MSVQINRMCYFPLDVRFFENDKIESITTKFGLRAVPIVIRLLCDIHADGYYIRWDDDKSRLMARKLGTRNVVFINQVVQGLLEIGFFDAESYTKHGILTSKSIQEVYLDFIGKCRSNYIQNTEYLIIDQRPKRKYTKRQIQIDEKCDSKSETNNSPYNINKIKGNKIKRNIAAEAAAKRDAVGAAASATSAAGDACFENFGEATCHADEEVAEAVLVVDPLPDPTTELDAFGRELLADPAWLRSMERVSGLGSEARRRIPAVFEAFISHLISQGEAAKIRSVEIFARRFTNWCRQYLPHVHDWLETLGEIDALTSLATYAFNHPENTYAILLPNNSETVFRATALYHPFLSAEQAVPNDFELSRKNIALVTGANMAGKSTFLRTVGVNYVLAHTGAPVCARSFQMAVVSLFSSMRTTDNLSADVSYFHAELIRLKQLLLHIQNHPYTLVILDEILKGTNSQDKLKGSRLFLEELARYPVSALVATHDLELAALEEKNPQQYRNYCFEIELSDEIQYSYRIQQGVAKNLNASYLLQKVLEEVNVHSYNI